MSPALQRPSRRTSLIAVGLAACFAWWGFRPSRIPLPEAGPVVLVGADGDAGALRQVFVPPLAHLSALVVQVQADAPARLVWTLDLAALSDPFRRGQQVASGVAEVAAGRSAAVLPVHPPVAATDREALLHVWFDGAGASQARLETSGLDAYPGRFDAAGASRFGDLRLAVSGPNLYSDLRLRLVKAPAWLQSPLVHLVAIVIFLAALTRFIADVTAARGEQG